MPSDSVLDSSDRKLLKEIKHQMTEAIQKPDSGILSSTERRARLWIELGSKFGVPTVMLAVVVAGFWLTSKWFASEVAEPVVKSHIVFLDKTIQTQEAIVRTQDEIVKEQKRSAESQDSMNRTLTQLIEEYRETRRVMLKVFSDKVNEKDREIQ